MTRFSERCALHDGAREQAAQRTVRLIETAGLELVRIATRNRFPLSPLAIGLGVLVPPESVLAMFAGAAFFEIMNARYRSKPGSMGFKLWIETHEPICAGLVAGAALVGIGDTLVRVFLLR